MKKHISRIFFLVFISSSFFVIAESGNDLKLSHAAIASAHLLATQAGHDILAAGGNAFDAAIAVSATLSVVEPYSSGIGGGGFFLLHRSEDGFETFLDAREKAPLAAHRDMYLDKEGNVIKGLSSEGPLAAGIPGLPMALAHLAEKYGSLPLEKSLAPAIRYADEGFKVTLHYQKLSRRLQSIYTRLPEQASLASRIFLQDNQEPKIDYLIVQKDLATTLRALAKHGSNGFYKGEVAEKLVKGVKEAGGIWSLDDLEQYRVVEREPLRGNFRGMKITTAPPPSSGGVSVLTILNILDQLNVKDLKLTATTHITIEAMRRAYRDRAQYMGDPDFIEMPIEKLTHPFYAAGLAASIRLDKATPSAMLPGLESTPSGMHTTHFSILDRNGNRVAATQTINNSFGSGFIPPGTGVLLNDEMDDFSSKAGVPNSFGLVSGENANAIAPSKRMLSSMTPTFLETEDRVAILGTPGGSRIITMMLLAALEFHKGGDAKAMVSLPRYHHQYLPDAVTFEKEAFTRDQQLELQMLGHQLKEHNGTYGNMHVVVWDKKKNKINAAADSRVEGEARVR